MLDARTQEHEGAGQGARGKAGEKQAGAGTGTGAGVDGEKIDWSDVTQDWPTDGVIDHLLRVTACRAWVTPS